MASRASAVTAGEITRFESLGLAVEDVAAAHFACQRALETGAGQPSISGERTHEAARHWLGGGMTVTVAVTVLLPAFDSAIAPWGFSRNCQV